MRQAIRHGYPFIEEGSFGNKKIYYSFFESEKKSNTYLILFHGSFSTSLPNDKNSYIINALTKNGINVCVYETSRNINSFKFNGPFEEYKNVFGEKTFQEEKEDVKHIFNFFFETYIKNNEQAQVYFCGSSLGGTICSYLLTAYSERVKAVFLLGSGVTTKGGRNTYPGYPKDKQEILYNFEKYKGAVILVQGTDDTVVPQEDARQILAVSQKAKKIKHIVLEGVDHSFRKINGKLAIQKISKRIVSIILAEITEEKGSNQSLRS